eukprot:g1916.t1
MLCIVDVALALLTAEAILRTPSSRVVVVVYAGADHIRKQAKFWKAHGLSSKDLPEEELHLSNAPSRQTHGYCQALEMSGHAVLERIRHQVPCSWDPPQLPGVVPFAGSLSGLCNGQGRRFLVAKIAGSRSTSPALPSFWPMAEAGTGGPPFFEDERGSGSADLEETSSAPPSPGSKTHPLARETPPLPMSLVEAQMKPASEQSASACNSLVPSPRAPQLERRTRHVVTMPSNPGFVVSSSPVCGPVPSQMGSCRTFRPSVVYNVPAPPARLVATPASTPVPTAPAAPPAAPASPEPPSAPTDELMRACEQSGPKMALTAVAVIPVPSDVLRSPIRASSPWANEGRKQGRLSHGQTLSGMAFLSGILGFGRRRSSAATQVRAKGGWPGSFVSGDAAQTMREVRWPEEWPYTEADFARQDESTDTGFYTHPRICTHVDDNFIATLNKHYGKVFPTYPNATLFATVTLEYELQQNKQADDYTVRDLNENPKLPYEDSSFDIVTCTVSFDYLCKPLEVMKEVGRVLKPGGMVILSTSNRCFPTKAVNIWLQTGDLEHVLIYGSYMILGSKIGEPRPHICISECSPSGLRTRISI